MSVNIYTGKSITDYAMFLEDKVSKNIQVSNKLEKIIGEIDIIPKFSDYNVLLNYNYNIKQLKQCSKEYKLKLTGNKQQLTTRLFAYLYLSNLAIKIQKIIRGCLQRKYNNIHGPAYKNRLLCTNNFDFLSMDELTNIPNEQFFSFRDEDGFIYGFDILSLYNLIYKCNGLVNNPFNKKPISSKIIENFRSLLRLSRVLKINIITEIDDVTKDITDKKAIELRAITLFQNMDALGNYTDTQWFLTLNIRKLRIFITELADIWNSRARLTTEMKRMICPPYGNPFQGVPNYRILNVIDDTDEIRKICLGIMERFINSSADKDNKCLGAYYILAAITLVNHAAATSLPWLYQAACYM